LQILIDTFQVSLFKNVSPCAV